MQSPRTVDSLFPVSIHMKLACKILGGQTVPENFLRDRRDSEITAAPAPSTYPQGTDSRIPEDAVSQI